MKLFQFIKPLYFNSLMVRLKVPDVETELGATAFQFLNGAIKRVEGDSMYPTFNQFQFLNGAIKSIYRN